MKKAKWWHLSGYNGTFEIYQGKSMPTTCEGDGNWYGPFDTFTAAKNDAISYHQTTKDDALRNINNLRNWKKLDC